MNILHRFLSWFLDILFPQDELTARLSKIKVSEFLEAVPRSLNEQHIISFFEYRHPLMRKAIWEMKYRRNMNAIRLLAKASADFVVEEVADEYMFSAAAPILLIPIPLSSRRKRERSYNQMEEFCKLLLQELPENLFQLETSALKKVRHTEPQTKTKNRMSRLLNIKDVFKVVDEEKIKRRVIVLLDDVQTSGSTLSEAARVLHEAGAKRVFPIALAH